MIREKRDDGEVMAALGAWAKGRDPLTAETLAPLLRFDQPEELDRCVEACFGVPLATIARVLSSPYYRSLVASGPEAIGRSMMEGGRERPLRPLRLSPIEAGSDDPRVEQPWSVARSEFKGSLFWLAWSGDQLRGLSSLGPVERAGERHWKKGAAELEAQALAIQSSLSAAFGEPRKGGEPEASERLRWALTPQSPMREGPIIAPLGTPDSMSVWRELVKTPPGRAVGYTELARRAGVSGGAPAARAACESSPIELLLPCHRAVEDCGGLGVYRWGRDAKAILLVGEFIRSR